jgi:RHS repeat-associated protein
LNPVRESEQKDFLGTSNSKEIEAIAGLYYFNARWYDPELGRFITEDPIKDGLNWYSYVSNRPLTHIDPTGLYIVRNTNQYAFYMQNQQDKDNGKDKPKGVPYGASGYVHSSDCAITMMAKAISAITGDLVTPEGIANKPSIFSGNNIVWDNVANKYDLKARRVDIDSMSYDDIQTMIEMADRSSEAYAYGFDLKYGDHSHFVNAVGTESIGGKDYVEIDPTSINDIAGLGAGERVDWISLNGKIYVPINKVQDLIEVREPFQEPDPYRNGMNDVPSGGTGSGGTGSSDSSTDTRFYY